MTTAMPSHAHAGFTSNLINHLNTTRSRIDSFCTNAKAKCDGLAISNQTHVLASNREMERLLVQLNDIRRLRGVVETGGMAEERREMESERKKKVRERDSLEENAREAKEEVEALRERRDELRVKAEEVRFANMKMNGNTVDDLTKGILYYKKLGLDFKKAGKDKFRIAFSLIDPGDPKREFAVTLAIREDRYDLEECRPEIPEGAKRELLRELNESQEDVAGFVRGMRRAFIEAARD